MLWSCFLSIGIYNTFFEIEFLNMVLYAAMCREKIGAVLFPTSWIISVLLIAGAYVIAIKYALSDNPFDDVNRALRPLWFMPLLFFIPIGVHSTYLFVMICGLVLFRYLLLFHSGTILHEHKNSSTWKTILPVLLMSVLFITYGYYLQKKAFDTAYLCWADWGYFYESLHNTLKGKWFWLNKMHINFLGSRFCLGLAILLPYMKLFGSPYAFFLMSSVVLGSGGIMIYTLCRILKFSTRESMFFGIIYFLIPGFFNMNLCLVYGFHEIYFAIPTVLAAFCFYEKKNYTAAIIFFLFSMTFQETIPVLWLSFGLIALAQRRLRLAATLIIISLCCYFLINSVAIPYLRGHEHYTSMFRYEHLGSSIGQVALSPLTRPGAFWGSLLRPGTFYFLIVLLLPVFILTLSSPLGLGAAAIIFVFLCIEMTDQTQNIMRHYQTMILIVILINTIYAYRRIKEGWISPWLKWLAPKENKGVFRDWTGAVLFSSMFTALLCFLLYANTHLSKNPVPDFGSFTDFRPESEIIAGMIPAEAKITATSRMAAVFCGRNDVYQDFDPSTGYPLQEYILLDLLDPMNDGVQKLFELLRTSGEYGLIHSYSDETRFIVLFKKGAKTNTAGFISHIPPEQWKQIGIPVPSPNKDLSVRVVWQPPKTIKVMSRYENKTSHDVIMRIVIEGNNGEVIRKSELWGKGIVPATNAQPGDTCMTEIQLPGEMVPKTVAVKFEPYP